MLSLTVGKRLKEVRERLGLTQKQVSGYLGINQVQLSYYETSKREIGLGDLEKLSRLYGYTVDHFVNGDADGSADMISVAFKAGEVNDADMKLILWAKQFLDNVYEMNEIQRSRHDQA
jgi:transcriptional regulator with XRE-family HTH domain